MTDENKGVNALSGLSSLAALYAKPELKDTWFNGKEVKLDGFRFVNCRFDNCSLTISSNNIELINCLIDDKSTIYFEGDVINPIKLFNRKWDLVYETAPLFAPVRNADGTITIA